MLENLEYNGRLSTGPRKDPRTFDARVDAKARFWDFIQDIKSEVANWPDSETELAGQFVSAALLILYPAFDAIETSWIVADAYRTMLRPLPADFHGIFHRAFVGYIQARISKLH